MTRWEDYVIDETNVLKNKFGITDNNELKQKETEIVVTKLAYLYIHGMEGNFDEKHLCNIHKFLFDEIYEFAGVYREVNIYKYPPEFSTFENIHSDLLNLFDKMSKITVNSNNKFEIAEYLADFYYELIMIHPFREGNGRSIREFIRQFALNKFPDYELDYTKINKENFKIGIVDRQTYPLLLAFEINNGLTEVDKSKKKEKVYF